MVYLLRQNTAFDFAARSVKLEPAVPKGRFPTCLHSVITDSLNLHGSLKLRNRNSPGPANVKIKLIAMIDCRSVVVESIF
jgi:hypothetical protein